MNQFLQRHQEELAQFAKQNRLAYLGLFGSYARNEASDSSDVDLLVQYPPGTSLFDVANFEQQLEKILNKKIDLVSKKYINKYLKPYIETDLIPIYEQR